MDPLSITASAFTFIDIAKRIKDSVEKVAQNRQTLDELMDDVVEELTQLQRLCQDQQGRLSHLDPESARSLEKLHSDLVNVLDRCLKLTKRRTANRGLSSLKYYVIAWIKNAEIEGHILRLRDRVSSVNRRLNIISALRVQRAESELLVASSEHRAILNRLEGSVSQLLINSHTLGTYPASLLDRVRPDGVEYQYLHLQVQRTADLLRRISATYIFTTEEIRGPQSFEYRLIPHEHSRANLMRSTIIQVLQTLQSLEHEPSNLALWEGAQHLFNLGISLNDLDLEEDAVAIFMGLTVVYQTLMQRNPGTYLPYVTWGLGYLAGIYFGTPEGLGFAKQAVDICGGVAATLQDGSSLARSLSIYALHLAENDDFDSAVTFAKEALAIQRKVSTPQQDPGCLPVTWEASGEEPIVLSSARTIFRTYDAAINDAVCLRIYADSLIHAGRWSEALIVTTEVVNCLGALAKCSPLIQDLNIWLGEMHEDHQYIIANICSPDPPLVASISEVADLDDSGHEDDFGEDASSKSALLVQT
ncbi:hypothetical protein PLEOSDRAFT_153422 [Pleurotus ostreatus PC15]|uniref:Fungal N-terminal domain-containing protein n=1 Tax=Pleurotus ostreatus (strain PC15) TaxID=1137138 RepID=A0A067PAK4_PLEO1|nr:hypothetical protein PLEOSDRAFT_153422 [Pleurotus ostreatus PC15]